MMFIVVHLTLYTTWQQIHEKPTNTLSGSTILYTTLQSRLPQQLACVYFLPIAGMWEASAGRHIIQPCTLPLVLLTHLKYATSHFSGFGSSIYPEFGRCVLFPCWTICPERIISKRAAGSSETSLLYCSPHHFSLPQHTHHIAESVLRTKACVSNSPTGEPWGCGGIGYGIGCCYILRVYVYGCDLDKQWMAKHWVVSTQTRDFRCLLPTSLQFEPNSELLSFYFNRFKLLVARWFLRPAIWACPVAAAWTVRVTDWFPCELLPCTNLECMASVFICIRRPCSSVTHSEYCCWITSLCQY